MISHVEFTHNIVKFSFILMNMYVVTSNSGDSGHGFKPLISDLF